MRDDLEVARDRLARARSELKAGRAALADRLVELYKADEPDALTVSSRPTASPTCSSAPSSSSGSPTRTAQIVARVKVLKARAEKSEGLLAKLEDAQADRGRDDPAPARRHRLHARPPGLRAGRAAHAAQRPPGGARQRAQTSARSPRATWPRCERAGQAGIAQLAGRRRRPAGPIRRGSGRLIWPVNGPITSAVRRARPGHLHAGIDIAAPAGTPIRAADSGRVVLAGWTGGYGNYTCIQHTGSLSTCYGHQSRYRHLDGPERAARARSSATWAAPATRFGDHLHFEVRVSGSPVDPLGYL